MGMNNAYMSIGNVLGPLLAGLLFDVHILYPFILGLIVLVITIICLDEVERSTEHLDVIKQAIPIEGLPVLLSSVSLQVSDTEV